MTDEKTARIKVLPHLINYLNNEKTKYVKELQKLEQQQTGDSKGG